MRLIRVPIDKLHVVTELARSRRDRLFEEHLMLSIKEAGLVEPLKVAPKSGSYIVVDGVLRLEAIQQIRKENSSLFEFVPAYLVPYSRRFELRFQADIYQDLLPSQLAALVEHLHKMEGIKKKEIARFIGISSATLRNYTGLWRMVQRGGLFSEVVRLMDHGIVPASNPFAWLRLNVSGIERILQEFFAHDRPITQWLNETLLALAESPKHSIQYVEEATGSLPGRFYREGPEVRSMKKKLGEKKSHHNLETVVKTKRLGSFDRSRVSAAKRQLRYVRSLTSDPVLIKASQSIGSVLE